MSLKKTIFALSALVLTSTTHATESNYPYLSKVTTEAKQAQITPVQALKRLKEGNKRFLTNNLIQRNYLAQAKQSSYGQFPWAVILNCMDSRSVPELIFNQGLADLFTLRVAGNVLNDDNLGSLEFATKAAGARLIVVLGHTSCGAVAGACEKVQLGHLNHVLSKIEPFVAISKKQTGINNCQDMKLVDEIAKINAINVSKQIRSKSPIINQLIESGQVGIIAGMHNIRTGEVTFYDNLLEVEKN